ncbi:MAG: hypothetical protein AB2L14_13550 [Candidatus Xenobiia bacterium LiM19]
MRCRAAILIAILSLFAVMILYSPSSAGDGERTAFTIMSIDNQFFTTPYERTAILGGAYMGREGSPASVILNPAALHSLRKADAMVTWTQKNYKGTGGAAGKNNDEDISAQLSDTGLYVALPLGDHGSVMAFGADMFDTSFSSSPMTEPKDTGSRVFAAFSSPLSKSLSWGYGLMYLDDNYAWGTGWFDGRQFSRFYLKNQSQSWRHRLALQGNGNGSFCWGLQCTLGYGDGVNYWNGIESSGRDKLQYSALRGGGQWVLSKRTKLACDIECQWNDIQFGHHPVSTGKGGGAAYYKGDVLRAMAGIEQSVGDSIVLRGGYRYSSFKMEDFCNRNAQHDASTASLGIDWKLDGDRLNLSWNGEYTWLGYGDFTQTLSLRYRF